MLKSVKIRNKELLVPIIQGGMGVGISLGKLAGHVMKNNAMGVISCAHPGYQLEGFRQNSIAINEKGLQLEIDKARAISEGKGLLAVNAMVASTDYDTYVKCAVANHVDAIISGAGLPLHLPKLVEDESILLAPIVSSAKAMKLILKSWSRHYNRLPDFVVIEGCEAGGHLGFKKEDLINGTCVTLEEILLEVVAEIKPYEEEHGVTIPVFVAGGIFNGQDIAKMITLGASGVQMGTRFIATQECDASEAFKQAVINCTKEDIRIVHSPTGFPGRGLNNAYIQRITGKPNISMKQCLECLKPCTPMDTPYCISEALIQSALGNVDNGLIFVGSKAHLIHEMTTVETLINTLIEEANQALKG